MRIIGSTIAGAFSGADKTIFDGLAQRGELREIIDARLSFAAKTAILLRAFRPQPRAWGRRWYDQLVKSTLAFCSRTRFMDRQLRTKASDYDIVLHVSGLFAPFRGTPPRPIVIFCDYTTRLAERRYTKWCQLSGREARTWFELETQLYRGAARILTASQNTRRSFIDDYGIAPERVLVVGEGVSGVYEHEGRDYTIPRILFVGLDFERKGGADVLAAFARIREIIPWARLRTVGPSPQGQQPGVEWLGEVRDRRQMEALFRSSTLFVMPSYCEPFGLALIEAMAHGLPVIGSRVDAMPEIVLEENTGLLVNAGDRSQLAACMARLLLDPTRCAHMGAAGRERVRERFLWSQTIDRINAALTEVYAESRPCDSARGPGVC